MGLRQLHIRLQCVTIASGAHPSNLQLGSSIPSATSYRTDTSALMNLRLDANGNVDLPTLVSICNDGLTGVTSRSASCLAGLVPHSINDTIDFVLATVYSNDLHNKDLDNFYRLNTSNPRSYRNKLAHPIKTIPITKTASLWKMALSVNFNAASNRLCRVSVVLPLGNSIPG